MPGGAGFLPSTVFVPLNIGRFICGPMILSNAHPAEFKKKMILLQEKSHWSFPHKAVWCNPSTQSSQPLISNLTWPQKQRVFCLWHVAPRSFPKCLLHVHHCEVNARCIPRPALQLWAIKRCREFEAFGGNCCCSTLEWVIGRNNFTEFRTLGDCLCSSPLCRLQIFQTISITMSWFRNQSVLIFWSDKMQNKKTMIQCYQAKVGQSHKCWSEENSC